MNRWSRKYDKCGNCQSDRFKHVAKGYCRRCYGLIKRLNEVEHWDPANPQSLKGFPSIDMPYDSQRFSRVFKKIQSGVASQIRGRLAFLKAREERLNYPIQGIDIEHGLRRIAQCCGTKDRNLFFGIAGYIDLTFDLNQRKILYEWLNRIEENIPWRGINWNRVFLSGH